MPTVSVAEAKSRLSELLAKSAYGRERFVITRRNRPIAALVSLDDLRIVEQYEEKQGLAAIAGKWPDFTEVGAVLDDIKRLRRKGGEGP